MTNFSLVIGVLALASMALLLIRRRRQKANPARTRSDFPDSEPDSFAEFETQMRLAFGFALLNSGYGSTQVWVTLRRAIKDIFLSFEGAQGSPVQAEVQRLAQELGKMYGLFVWAYDRQSPDDKNHLGKFVATFAPRPWEGLLDAEPQRSLDCYDALTKQTGRAFLVVAKSGILMAQQEEDRIAEGLLWGALADMTLKNYDDFHVEARNALDRLPDCGTQVILAFPGGFDAFAGPFEQLSNLLQTLQGSDRNELTEFVAKLKTAYGEKFKERYGRDLPG